MSILQGLTSRERARVTVVTTKKSKLFYLLRDGATTRECGFTRVEGPRSDDVIDHVEVTGLRPAVDFELIVIDARDGVLRDRRTLRSIDPNKTHARIALVSATDDHRVADAQLMWPEVLSQSLDAILLIGDNVFVDNARAGSTWIRPDPPTLWRRYAETRAALPLFFASRLVPTLATWDDHDFAHAGADKNYPFGEDARRTFLSFFAQDAVGDQFGRGPGIASWWRAFGIEIGLTDNRSFRSVNHLAEGQTHFGSDQRTWIAAQLAAAQAPVVLISGDQFFGGYHPFESFEGSHPEDFKKALAEWRAVQRTPLVFASGDRRLSEILAVPPEALGYPTFEITSSGLHAGVFKDTLQLYPSPHQMVGVAGQLNYSVIEIMRAELNLLRLSVQSFGRHHQLLYQRTLMVKR